MINANGSKLDKTSFGIPSVDISPAWDVKLLLIWLYASPADFQEKSAHLHPSNSKDGEPRTVNRKPAENSACFHPTLHLIHPLIIKRHPSWPSFNSLFTWFGVLPERGRAEVLVCLYRVKAPFSTSGKSPEAESCSEDGSCRWRAGVSITSDPENDWTK